VVGTVGSDEKAEVARRCGCNFVIHYRRENFANKVLEFTGGRGVDVAYDSVGKDTFFGSLDALGLFGHLVHFGQSSGPVDPRFTAISPRAWSCDTPLWIAPLMQIYPASMACTALATYGFPPAVRWPRAASAADILRSEALNALPGAINHPKHGLRMPTAAAGRSNPACHQFCRHLPRRHAGAT
jgi:NADPH2:quinone reductase